MVQNISFSKIISAAHQEATGAKTSAYVLTTTLTGMIYALVTIVVLMFVPDSLKLPAWGMLSFLLALTFSPIRYAMEELIRQLFPSTDYNSHELIKHLNSISYSTLTLKSLIAKFFNSLEDYLGVSQSAFLIIDPTDMTYVKTHDGFAMLSKMPQADIDFLVKHVDKLQIHTQSLKDTPFKQLLTKYKIMHIFRLDTNERTSGILLFGEKREGGSFTTKDIKVMTAVSPKLAYAIKNALRYERVKLKNTTLITELKEANQQLRLANRNLKKDDKLKDELVFIATHELKNPVTAIKGYLSLIHEGRYGKVTEKLNEPLVQIHESNQQLINLLNNLLQIARTEAKGLEIKTQPVQLCKVIDSVINDLNPLVEQKKLKINHICANPSTTVISHEDRLREIMNNLISNAIKYSDKGEISISHELRQDQLITHVTDQGVGIADKDKPKIFTRFFRVEEEAVKGIPGTGLGLFIIKELVERMSGRIWFQSKRGEGSVFSFSLPLSHSPIFKIA